MDGGLRDAEIGGNFAYRPAPRQPLGHRLGLPFMGGKQPSSHGARDGKVEPGADVGGSATISNCHIEMPALERLGRETTPEIERLAKMQAQIIEIGRIERLRPNIVGKEGHIAEADGKYSKSKVRSA